ncbi:hypothetical protein SAMN06297251_101456 [Fulvimarina manganoxydans]|uniref:Uncharacterized protein n=1 Tax=Fulvimarina manganoxydans TaxID=937218 RepID=A0A1W1YLS8_9HYPH|nr:hypothetical protein [Fulvimarina manganoxydans]SMC37137.1 hypothetical protein SAMN06297251_101456 [Fulvimarina manganoxydans]
MNDYDVKITGTKKPHKRPHIILRILDAPWDLTVAALKRPRVLMLLGGIWFACNVGTPHIGSEYQCRYPTRPGQPCQSFNYCIYHGFQGRRVVVPVGGETCGLFKLIPPDWEKLAEE